MKRYKAYFEIVKVVRVTLEAHDRIKAEREAKALRGTVRSGVGKLLQSDVEFLKVEEIEP
jgi:hypothetical protein